MSHGTIGQDDDFAPATPAERRAKAKEARELRERARANLADAKYNVQLAEMALASAEENARRHLL